MIKMMMMLMMMMITMPAKAPLRVIRKLHFPVLFQTNCKIEFIMSQDQPKYSVNTKKTYFGQEEDGHATSGGSEDGVDDGQCHDSSVPWVRDRRLGSSIERQEAENEDEAAKTGQRHRVARHVDGLPLLVEPAPPRPHEVAAHDRAAGAKEVHDARPGEVEVVARARLIGYLLSTAGSKSQPSLSAPARPIMSFLVGVPFAFCGFELDLTDLPGPVRHRGVDPASDNDAEDKHSEILNGAHFVERLKKWKYI